MNLHMLKFIYWIKSYFKYISKCYGTKIIDYDESMKAQRKSVKKKVGDCGDSDH